MCRLSPQGLQSPHGELSGDERKVKVTNIYHQSRRIEPSGSAFKTGEPLLRNELGDVLRSLRSLQGRTLREVSSDAQVSLGYLSEVERGQKEASSELLESITKALGVPLWFVLREVSDRMMTGDETEVSTLVPDTVPDELLLASMAQMR